ncbi:MAG: hypothetical protein ABSF52_06130 [Syntrophobacteraceae bacterium]
MKKTLVVPVKNSRRYTRPMRTLRIRRSATRLNSYFAVEGPYAALQAKLGDLLPPEGSRRLLDVVRGPDR